MKKSVTYKWNLLNLVTVYFSDIRWVITFTVTWPNDSVQLDMLVLHYSGISYIGGHALWTHRHRHKPLNVWTVLWMWLISLCKEFVSKTWHLPIVQSSTQITQLKWWTVWNSTLGKALKHLPQKFDHSLFCAQTHKWTKPSCFRVKEETRSDEVFSTFTAD